MRRRLVRDMRRKKHQEQLRRFSRRAALAAGIIAFGAAFLYFSGAMVLKSPVFRIREIVATVPFGELENLKKELSAASLIRVNVVRYARSIKRMHPEFKAVSVLKVFPHTLRIVIEKRNAFAQVAIGRKYYVIDEEAVVISEGNIEKYPSVIACTGRTFNLPFVRKGVALYSEELNAGLLLIKELRSGRILERYPSISAVSIASLHTISFELGNVLIHVGEPPYREKITLLSTSLLPQLKDAFNDLRQIDLRFTPPVIGYKR